MKKIFITILVASTILSCNQQTKEKNSDGGSTPSDIEKVIPVESDAGIGNGALSITDHFINNIEKAHDKNQYLSHKLISFNIDLRFGGTQRLDGKITMFTNSSKIRIDKKNGDKLIFNGDNMFICPLDANDKGARFDMFTWSYFFNLPYKLSDPGTQWEMKKDRALNDTTHSTAKLSFKPGTGDSPDDWYLIYVNPESRLLQAAAYIVTYGSKGDISKAASDPHMIKYIDYKNVDSIQFATKWGFYGWTEDKGATKQLGEAIISDITFLEDEGDLFETPENAKEISL